MLLGIMTAIFCVQIFFIKWLLAKNQFACFTEVLDDDLVEVRRITDASWKLKRREENATYNARTHLFNSRASDNQEGDIVNVT